MTAVMDAVGEDMENARSVRECMDWIDLHIFYTSEASSVIADACWSTAV